MGSGGIFTALRNWWLNWRAAREVAKRRETASNQALEALIDMAGLKVRAVSSYAKKLRPAMCPALDHIDDVVATIPGTLEISPQAWNHDPKVNALFVTQEELVPLFYQRGEAKSYFKKQHPDEAFALLTMDREDRTVLTIDQQGAIVRRDIPRTSVTFKNHRLVSLGQSEEETRADIKTRALNVLATLALEEISQTKSRELELKELENLYKVKLSMMTVQAKGADLPDGTSREIKAEITELRSSLEQVRSDLRLARSSMEGQLSVLERAVASAPELLKAKDNSVLLNEFSMIAKSGSGERSHQVNLARITMGEEFHREAVVVRFKRSDFS